MKTEPIVPELGETATLAVTLRRAHSPTGTSFAGVPLTVMFHLMSVVAFGPTMKLPVATCELIVQVGEVITKVFGNGTSIQPVSVIEKPVPLKVTRPPLVWLEGKSMSVATANAVKFANALSPVEPFTVIR